MTTPRARIRQDGYFVRYELPADHPLAHSKPVRRTYWCSSTGEIGRPQAVRDLTNRMAGMVGEPTRSRRGTPLTATPASLARRHPPSTGTSWGRTGPNRDGRAGDASTPPPTLLD